MLTEHFNKKCVTQKRKYLRNNATSAEKILWQSLKGQQLGAKFRRQYSVDYYIIDFYCPELKLAIEIDGESHFTQSGTEYDAERENHIRKFGIRFLRFTNIDVFDNLDNVITSISNEIENMKK